MKRSNGMIAEQRRITDALEARLQTAPGTAEAPVVIVDPYGIAPLSALICFETAQEEAFEVSLLDAEGRRYLTYQTPAALAHRIIVPAIVNGQVCRVQAQGTGGSAVSVTLPVITVEAPMQVQVEGNAPADALLYALPADGAGLPVAVDYLGRLCWMLTLPLNQRLTMLEDGHFLCGAPLQLAPPYSGTALWEMDALGHVYKEYRFEDGFAGDYVRLPNGTIVAITQAAYRGTARDVLVWIDGKTGAERMRLRAADILPAMGGTAGQSGTDWFQGASLRFDETSGLLYWSGLAQNVVVEIDAATAEVTRIIGHTDGWDEEHTAMALFKRPVIPGTFEEAYGVQRWGDALYYVNANRYPLGRKIAPTPFNINRLDLKSGRVSMFLPNEGALISPVFCDLTLLTDAQALVLAGGLSDSRSLVPAVFARERQEDIQLSAKAFLYHEAALESTWTFDDNIIDVTLWRPARSVLSYSSAVDGVLGGWAPCFEIDLALPVTSEGPLAGELDVQFWQDESRLSLSGTFYQGEVCLLILRRGEERHQFYLTTNRQPFGTDWLYTYINGEERRLNWAIPCAHLKGEWEIDLQIDDMLYHSGESAVF